MVGVGPSVCSSMLQLHHQRHGNVRDRNVCFNFVSLCVCLLEGGTPGTLPPSSRSSCRAFCVQRFQVQCPSPSIPPPSSGAASSHLAPTHPHPPPTHPPAVITPGPPTPPTPPPARPLALFAHQREVHRREGRPALAQRPPLVAHAGACPQGSSRPASCAGRDWHTGIGQASAHMPPALNIQSAAAE